jgi:PQQ-dependent catabolism-associated CXXCW motif protein
VNPRAGRIVLSLAIAGALFTGSLLAADAASASHSYIGPEGYRTSHYRAPTPHSVPNAATLDTVQLQALMETDSVALIDVQAVVTRPEAAEFGFSWLLSKPRYNIPGSFWLPNVGYGTLEPNIDSYFRGHLLRVTGNRNDRPLVFYCIADCWMSWNAVQRAYRYGYRNLYWYRGGTDAWEEAGLPLTEDEPEPMLVSAVPE